MKQNLKVVKTKIGLLFHLAPRSAPESAHTLCGMPTGPDTEVPVSDFGHKVRIGICIRCNEAVKKHAVV